MLEKKGRERHSEMGNLGRCVGLRRGWRACAARRVRERYVTRALIHQIFS